MTEQNNKQSIGEIARKKRHLSLIEKLSSGKTLTNAEIAQIDTFEALEVSTKKETDTRWQKCGKSPNPRGRPKGIKDKRTFCKQLLFSNSDDLLQTAIQMAKRGNEAMLRLLLERVLPPRPKEDSCLPILKSDESFTDQANKVIDSVMNNDISISDGVSIIKMLKDKADLIQITDIIEKLEKLEARIKND